MIPPSASRLRLRNAEWQFPPAALRISQRLEKRVGSYRWFLGLQLTPDVTSRTPQQLFDYDDCDLVLLFFFSPQGRTVVVTQEATLGLNHLHPQTHVEDCGVSFAASRFTLNSATMVNAKNRDTIIGCNVFWFPALGTATFVARYLYALTPHTHLIVDSGLLNDTAVTIRWTKLPLNINPKKDKNVTLAATVRGDSLLFVAKKTLSEKSKIKSETMLTQGTVRVSVEVERTFTPDLALGLSLVRDDSVLMLVAKCVLGIPPLLSTIHT